MTAILPTTPEPRGDIEAQLAALVDPDHPKRAVWVSKGSPVPLEAPQSIFFIELPAGRLYAAPSVIGRLLADPSQEMLAQILGYLECKTDLRAGELPVVQALNEGGWVVWETASSWEWVGAAKDIASRYGTRVRVVTMAACQERRARLIAEELA